MDFHGPVALKILMSWISNHTLLCDRPIHKTALQETLYSFIIMPNKWTPLYQSLDRPMSKLRGIDLFVLKLRIIMVVYVYVFNEFQIIYVP